MYQISKMTVLKQKYIFSETRRVRSVVYSPLEDTGFSYSLYLKLVFSFAFHQIHFMNMCLIKLIYLRSCLARCQNEGDAE